MKTFNKAFKELFLANFIEDANPHLIWINNRYEVTYYFSKQLIERLGVEVVI
jgi:hypothetical protein